MNENKKILVDQINKRSEKYTLVPNKYGYFSVSPMPSKEELYLYYQDKYFQDQNIVSEKGMDTGGHSELERFHYHRQYNELIGFIDSYFGRRDIKILDVGCGMGHLLKYLNENAFENLFGTEIDTSTTLSGIDIFHGDFLAYDAKESFDLIILNNVLEHVLEPEKFLEKCNTMLADGGAVRIQVPNDLSFAQAKALETTESPNYYFFSPREHLHYFDFDSMENLLRDKGFSVVKRLTTWPLEAFILMGIDYSKDPSLGKKCHQYRMNFEYKMGEQFLLDFYEKMAELEFGRVVIEYAVKK